MDGTILSFYMDNDSKQWQSLKINTNINGNKPPNMFGKDIFSFDHTNKGLQPKEAELSINLLTGHYRDAYNKNLQGVNMKADHNCTALIIKSGWTLPDNYPVKF